MLSGTPLDTTSRQNAYASRSCLIILGKGSVHILLHISSTLYPYLFDQRLGHHTVVPTLCCGCFEHIEQPIGCTLLVIVAAVDDTQHRVESSGYGIQWLLMLVIVGLIGHSCYCLQQPRKMESSCCGCKWLWTQVIGISAVANMKH